MAGKIQLPHGLQANKVQLQDGVKLYKRLLKYVVPYWPKIVIALLGTIVYSGLSSSFTYLVKPLLDQGFIAKNQAYIHGLPILFVLIFLFRGIAGFVANYFMAFVGKTVVMEFRHRIFQKLLILPAKFYNEVTAGELLSVILYNTAALSMACTNAVSMFVQNAFFAIGLIVVMLLISWQLTLIVLAAAPIFFWLMRSTNRRQRRYNLGIQDSIGDITHIAEETIEGYKVVRTFGGQDYESAKFRKTLLESRRREMKVVVTQGINTPAVQLVGACAIGIMLFLATAGYGSIHITAGGFAAMFAALMSLLKPIKVLTRINTVIQQGLAGAEGIFRLLDKEEEIDTGTTVLTTRAKGKVEFRNVGFSYRNSTIPVLKNINFSIKPGESVALVGRSGSGKTTLVNIIARFYDIGEGEVILDDQSIYDLRLTSLRDQISFVSQHITLFNDTIAHNIAYGRMHNIREEEIIRAAEAAHAIEFIRELPQGMQTMVGEDGLLLSGGQRQRIAIARAILKDAPILILDEATSALDTESERYIQEAMEVVMRNRTTFIIAHRLSTIQSADKIIVMDRGEIIEMGDHKTLMAQNGHYTRLHRMQFADIAVPDEEALAVAV